MIKKVKNKLYYQLQDIYSAETQLIEALSAMKEKAKNKQLRQAFSDHLKETKAHKKRLDEIGKALKWNLNGATCQTIKDIIRETKSFILENASDREKDKEIIEDAQRVEQYKLWAYGSALQTATALKHKSTFDKLEQTFKEEKEADRIFTKIAAMLRLKKIET